MRDYLGYELVKISKDVKEDKLRKAVRTGRMTLKAEDLKGTQPVLVHPMYAKAIKAKQAKGKGGLVMLISAPDVLLDMKFHKDKSIWKWMDDMKKKKAYNWVWAEDEE